MPCQPAEFVDLSEDRAMWLPAAAEEQQHGQHHGDHDAGQDAEHDHAEAGDQREHQGALADSAVTDQGFEVEQ